MAILIGKLLFGKDSFQYGLELCLHKAGREALTVTEETACSVDVLLVSCFWYRDAYALELFLRKSGLKHRKKGKPWIVIGGIQATICPELFARLGDAVFIGDADDHLGSILDQIEAGGSPESKYLYKDGDEKIPKPSECKPAAFCLHKGGRRDVARIEIARGCKFKCTFCALSGLKSYREVPFKDLDPVIRASSPSPCSCFAPERMYHSEWESISKLLESTGRRDLGQDARIEHLGGVPSAMVTTGVEGLSERLRKSIGKPFSDARILKSFGAFVSSRKHIARLSAYFIADLPGETDADWEAFEGLLGAIEHEEWSRWLVFQPILNPLSPKRHTPMSDAPVHPFRDYASRWKKILRRGGGKWGFRVIESMVWGPLERVMDVVVERGGRTAYDLISRMPDPILRGKPRMEQREALARRILTEAHKLGMTSEVLGVC